MVAVVSGSGLGLFNNSNAAGNSNVGRGRDQIFVNTTTGNLVVQSVDDTLNALGLDFAAIRTYNSQGLTDEDNNDQWRLGVHQRIYNLTGTVNTAGSTVTKVFGDGAEVIYTWNTTRSRYESGDGDGANDFLTWNSGNSTWTWTDGSSRATEEYGLVNSVQRIKFSRDTDGNTVTYNYTGSLLTSLNMAGATAQTVSFSYSGNNLTAIQVVSNGVTQTLTRYSYDASNRLQTVTLDLTPGDNSVTDNVTYTTTYTYDGASKRIASITQKDGSSVAFTYQNINGDYRLRTSTDAENRVTTFTYENVTGGGGGTAASAPANTAVLSNQDTANLTRIDSALTTNATQTTPYTRNDGALSTTDTQNVNYNRNDAALTTPAGGGGWAAPAGLSADSWSATQSSKTLGFAFDSNGNGFALTSVVDNSNTASLRLYRYTKSSNSWNTGVLVSSYVSTNGSAPPHFTGQLAVDSTGNAVIAWSHANLTGVSARRYSASSGTWSSTSTVSSTSGTSPLAVAVNGTRFIVVVQQGTTATSYRESGSSWTTQASLGNVAGAASVAIDAQGNITFGIAQGTSPTAADFATARYIVSIGVWSSPQVQESSSTTISNPRVAVDSSGNGFAVWAQGSDVMFSRLTGFNTWSTAAALDAGSGAVGSVSLAMDAAGNALVGWVQNDGSVASAYAKRYSASTSSWGSVVTLESSGQVASNIRVAINGNNAAATWTHNDGTNENVFAATYNGTAWSSATGIESISTGSAGAPQIAIDGSGNATAVWGWNGGAHVSQARFTPGSGGGTPYYTVPSGATWQSIANAVYNINSAAAGTALQTALGNPALTTGAQLTGFPAQLTVPTTVTVPAYYTIPSGASWQSIANAVYGINSSAAGSALQSALGNPTLTTGARLTGFPSTLNVTVTLAAHYLVPSSASWQSIATALFGSGANNSAGATALQTALGNPSIAAGQRLYSIPATLSVTTTVPYYYTVQSGNTWSGITQSIYGTTDANAITVLQAALGTSTLTVGARLTVPMTLSYTTSGAGGPVVYQQTQVQDALGLTTTYVKDSQGRLLSVQTPAVGGVRLETRYTYDSATGNVATITEDPNGLNRVTTFGYDANTGLLLSTRDSLGNTVTRTYNSNNQLATETSYLVRDPDGAGSGAPSSPLVKRFIYDSKNHLRFAISADGRVTEHVYDAGTNGTGVRLRTFTYAANTYSGTYDESSLASWASGQVANALERTDYTYDFRGNVSTVTAWAATTSSGAGTGPSSVTRFVYDQRGMLLTTVEARGEATSSPTNDYVTSFAYDGLGRLLTTNMWVSGSETARLLQTNSYDDANRRTVSTFTNGLVSTSTYNRSGDLISVANAGSTALGTTTYTYDANARLRVVTDATGVKSYVFYDDAGRKIAAVDGDGSLTETIYNRASQVIKTVSYAMRLGSTTLSALSGGTWSSVDFSTLRSEANATPSANQIARNVYDASGTLVYSIDELGAVTQMIYDGAGRLTDQIRFFNAQTIAASTDEVLPSAITIASNTADRRTRFFYNGDGQLTGTLDGAGCLTESVYDAAGRLVTTIGYFTVTNSSNWLTGTLATLRPSTHARDITTRFFYDSQGRQVGTLDGENYLTENVYDVAGQVTQTTRYDRVLTFTPGTSTFATLRSAAASATTHSTTYTYDGLGQVLTETNFEGTQTLYAYDVAGNVITVTRANGVSAEARTTAARYDVLGRVTQQLTGEGSVALAALGGSPTQTQIDDIWIRYGITFTYDNASRRTSMTVRPNDSTTLTTYYYYDNDGRLRFELDPRGQVTEHRYNALGQVTDSLVYWRTVSISSPTGGLLTASLITALTGTESANVHEKTTYAYSLRGEVTGTTSAAGATTSASYNIFGELQSSNAGSGFTATDYTYDARGLLDLTRRGGVTFEDRGYDAFGRLTSVMDARGNTTTFTHDRLGRELSSQQSGDANARTTGYDGFSRVLTVRDKLLNTTTYTYNDSTRTVTVTTPENVVLSTAHNRHGDTLTVTANGNTTTYTYGRNGDLTGASDSLGALEGRSYDRAGRQVTSTDARGTITTLAYDASSRVITRTEDSASGGLQLVTTYSYDPQNRILDVTEPGNRLTRTEYDRDGRVYRVIVDPNGATPSETRYTYDAANNVLTVTEGYGSAKPRRTQYVYDALGRRTDEYVDPTSLGGTLNLRTQYKYDNNDNVTRKIDAKGNSAWYVYDAQNRLIQSIDALGGVTQLTYDGEDRVTVTRRFYNTVTTGSFGDALAQQSVTTSVNDHVTRTVYDRDGRAVYTLETLSATGTNGTTETAVVTERTFDAAGNVTRTRIYRSTITVPASPVTTTNVSSLLQVDNDDRIEWTVYDLRGRPIYTIDGGGGVVKATYDLSGNVIATIAYADRIVLANLMPESTLTAFVNGSAGSNTNNRVTRFWYDSLQRARFSLDAEGYLVETKYLDSAKQEQTIVYASKPTIAANATLANVVSAIGSPQANDQVTTRTFDVAGRVVQITDANSKSEYFAYDAVGNKIRYVNKKAASATDLAYTWIYEYDANRRLEFERSPTVSVATVNTTTLIVAEATQQLVTHNLYDALGNVTSRIEGEGTAQARTTSYEYDLLGRQTAVISPTVGVYNAAGNGEWGAPGGAAVTRNETLTQIRSETAYDVFGNAFRNRVVLATLASNAGNGLYTYKVYDNLGRLTHEIDAKKQITSYVYDTFGNKSKVTRHAALVTSTLPSTGNGITLSQVSFNANAATDRTITTTFDRLNRATEIRQPSVRFFAPTPNAAGGAYDDLEPITENVYNAFGEVIRSRTKINSTDWATTYFYFDKLGRQNAQLDASRYLTLFEYDETGDLTRKLEYARPTTGTVDYGTYGTIVYTNKDIAAPGTTTSFAGYDRETTYTYDRLNRLTSENKRNLEYSNIVSGALTPHYDGVQTTTYGYDVLGNQTLVRTVNPDDGSQINTYSFYDVLGRLVATAAPARNLGNGISKIAYTRMLRDAHGNLVQQIEFYNGLAGNYFGGSPVDAPALPTAPAADANNDRKTTIVVDAQGQALRTRDATNADRFASYDIRGNVAKEWQVVFNPMLGTTSADDITETIVKLYRYDEVGQTVQVEELQRYNGANPETVTRVADYNAFGEITSKYNLGTVEAERQYFDYDPAGRVWRTNGEDGIDKVYMYDLAGNATLELRSKNIDLTAGRGAGTPGTYASARSVIENVAASDLMRTETVYDAKGQVVQRRMPSFDIDSRYPPVATDININTFSGAAYVYWTAVNPNMGKLTFGYRIAGSNSSYTNLEITSPSSGLQGVNVSDLTDQPYEFRLAATFPDETMPAAESTGTFRANRAVATSYVVTRTPPDPAAEISNLTIIPTAPVPANFSILQSATYSQPAQGAQTQWWGANRVHGDWEDVGNIAVRVQVTYYKRYRDSGGQTSGTYSTSKDFAAGAARTVAEWQIVPNDESQASEGGIHSIVAMRVYAINADGTTGALLRETNQGAQVNGLVWNAPADQTVTAYFRYKRTTDSTFSEVQATRIGTFFRVNVFPLLTSAATYNYVVEYRRGSTVIAKNEGEITSGGQQTTTTITGSISSNSFSTFNEFVATPSISGLTLSWAPPSQSVTASFEWGTSTAYGNTLGISQSSTWSVNLASIPTPSSTTTYFYRTVYRQGNRVVSQQTGTFSLTPPSSTVAAVASNGSPPGDVPPVSTVSGSSGVTKVTHANPRSANYGVPNGAPPQTQWQWWDVSIVTADFADVGNRAVRVVLQYFQKVKNSPGPSPGLATRSMDLPASGSRTQATFQWGITDSQAQYEGVYSVSSVRVYAINADGTTGSLLRDSFASATTPEPPSISWARPADITLVATLRIGGGSAVTPTLFAGRYQYSLAGIASNTFTIDYTRPGDSGPIVSLTGSFTNDGSNVEVTSQTAISRNPTWIGVSSSGASLSWSRAAESAGDVSFRYKVSGGSWQSLTPTGGPNYSVTFPTSGPNGTTNYIYEVRYVRSGEALPYVLSTGTVAVTVTNIAASAAFGSKSDTKYPTQQVVPSLSGNTVSWSFARENAGDTVTFRYSVGGNTYSTNLSGNGPSFSSVMSQLPLGTNTVNWWIEYSRAGESTFYASGSGTASMTFTQYTWPTALTGMTQRAVYPSGVAEIAAPYNLAGGYLAWDTPPNGATMAFTGNFPPVTIEAYGSGGRVNLSSLDAGNYNYEITYTTSGVVTARAVGTFTVVKTPGVISSMTRTIADQRVETAMAFVPTIEQTTVVYPPDAVYYLMYVPKYPTGDYVLVPGAKSWANGGGYRYVEYPNANNKSGTWERVNEAIYVYDEDRLAISFPPLALGVDAKVEFWLLSNPGVVSTASVSNPNGNKFVADISGNNGIANGAYGYRISAIRRGALQPIGVLEGTFTVGSTNSITVTASTSPAPVVATPTTKQSYDRWGNVIQVIDAANNISDYRYNAFDQLVQTLEAQDYVFDKRDAAGTKATNGINVRVEKTNSYDLLGRLIETQDGYDQASRVSYNAVGQQLTQRNADYGSYTGGATSTNVYDIFGNLIQTQDALGYRTRNKYDGLGRLSESWSEVDLNVFTDPTNATNLTAVDYNKLQSHIYRYDEAGRRISEANGMGQTLRYRYDMLGNVSLMRTDRGNITSYVYNADGKKTGETDAIGSTQSWTYDAFGRMDTHTQLANTSNHGSNLDNDTTINGGTRIKYTYNNAGLLFTQTSNAGQDATYSYDRGGNLASIWDDELNRKTVYRYDAAGRQSRESVVIDGRLHQDTRITYDNHNRVKGLDDPDYRERFLYDVNGNRAYVEANYSDHDRWMLYENYTYSYDAMNRVTSNVVFLRESQQYYITENTYNARGERVGQVAPGQSWEANGSNYRLGSTYYSRVGEAYTYDGLGRLTEVKRNLYQAAPTATQNPTNIPLRKYVYDLANRQTSEEIYSVESQTAFVKRVTTSNYDTDGRLNWQSTTKSTNGGSETTESRVNYGTSTLSGSTWSLGFDAANNLRGYEVQFYNANGGPTYKTTYKTNYYLSDGYLERSQSAVSEGSSPPGPGGTQRFYDANHDLMKFTDQEDAKRTRYFANNQAGQVLTTIRTDSSDTAPYWDAAVIFRDVGNQLYAEHAQYFFFFQNNQVGSFGESKEGGRYKAHFDVNSTPISENYPAATPSSVIAQAGDTLRGIAARVFGDASLWYVLAEENGLSDPDADLLDGMQLRVPNDVISLSNNSNSFKPFNIADALGDTTPTQPPPPAPKGGGCGVIGMIIMIVVMVVVTIFTAGAAAALMAPTFSGGLGAIMSLGAATVGSMGLAMGAVVGAVSSVITQGVGIALGIQDKFDWKQVAMGAISGGVGGAMNGAGMAVSTGSKVFNAAANAAISNAVTQGIAVTVGIQQKFSWKSVAQSAVAAPLANAAGDFVADKLGGLPAAKSDYNFAEFASDATRTVVTAGVRSAIGGRFDVYQVGADIFGNAIGNSIVKWLSAPKLIDSWKIRPQVEQREFLLRRRQMDEYANLTTAQRDNYAGGFANYAIHGASQEDASALVYGFARDAGLTGYDRADIDRVIAANTIDIQNGARDYENQRAAATATAVTAAEAAAERESMLSPADAAAIENIVVEGRPADPQFGFVGAIAPALVGTGAVINKLGVAYETATTPAVRQGIETTAKILDFAAGPAGWAMRKAFAYSPAGKAFVKAQESASETLADEIEYQRPGRYTVNEASMGGSSGIVLLMLALQGPASTLKGAFRINGHVLTSRKLKGILRGEEVEMGNLKGKYIPVKIDPARYESMRKAFDSTERSAFLKKLGSDPAQVAAMKKAGLTDAQIKTIQAGNIPHDKDANPLFNVHHKHPLKLGGDNSFDNLILIRNEPYHKVLTNFQSALSSEVKLTTGMQVPFPIPNGSVYIPGK